MNNDIAGSSESETPANTGREEKGFRLYDTAALSGVVCLFLGPVIALAAGGTSFLAATLGYTGIAIFTGGVAARYGFAESPSPVLQLLKNFLVALIVCGFFYGIFLLLYFVV